MQRVRSLRYPARRGRPDGGQPHAYAFVTSTTYSGDLKTAGGARALVLFDSTTKIVTGPSS
jgi:hypothetical protein